MEHDKLDTFIEKCRFVVFNFHVNKWNALTGEDGMKRMRHLQAVKVDIYVHVCVGVVATEMCDMIRVVVN